MDFTADAAVSAIRRHQFFSFPLPLGYETDVCIRLEAERSVWMLLDVGCWVLDVGCWMLDVYWMLVAEVILQASVYL